MPRKPLFQEYSLLEIRNVSGKLLIQSRPGHGNAQAICRLYSSSYGYHSFSQCTAKKTQAHAIESSHCQGLACAAQSGQFGRRGCEFLVERPPPTSPVKAFTES